MGLGKGHFQRRAEYGDAGIYGTEGIQCLEGDGRVHIQTLQLHRSSSAGGYFLYHVPGAGGYVSGLYPEGTGEPDHEGEKGGLCFPDWKGTCFRSKA